MDIYYSKRDFWLGAFLWGSIIASLCLIVFNFEPVTSMFIVLAVMLVSLALVAWLWFDTKYIITEDQLKINAGPIKYTPVPISKVTTVKKTKTWLSSPACSFDRIEINYNKYDSIVISPVKLKEFLAALNVINPSIKVEFKVNE